jgi:hypothetical protein
MTERFDLLDTKDYFPHVPERVDDTQDCFICDSYQDEIVCWAGSAWASKIVTILNRECCE